MSVKYCITDSEFSADEDPSDDDYDEDNDSDFDCGSKKKKKEVNKKAVTPKPTKQTKTNGEFKLL